MPFGWFSSASASATHRPRWLRWPAASLRTYLASAIVLATVPLACFALYLLQLQADAARAERQARLYRLASSVAVMVQRELASSAEALELISHDSALHAGDVAAFQRQLQRWPLPRTNWQALVLADEHGRPLFATHGEPPALAPLEGDAPRVGDLIRRAPGQPLATAVELPVSTPHGRYLLAAVIGAGQWQHLVDEAGAPPDGFVSLMDARERVIALSRKAPQLAGHTMSITEQAQALREPEHGPLLGSRGAMPLPTLQQVDGTGWWVGAGFTSAKPAWTELAALASVIGAALLSLLLGLALALQVARRVAEPVRALAEQGPGGVPGHVAVREIAALRDALRDADAQRDAAMQALQARADEFQALLVERQALVQREQQAREAAEQINRGKDEFLAMLGHELRNPLSAITAAIEVINRLGPTHDSSQSARRVIARQTRQLAGLMNDITDLARSSAGKMQLTRHPAHLARLVWRSASALRLAGRFKDHTLTLQLAPVQAEVDAMRIEQVVSNLLTNAAKYTPGAGHITLTLGAAQGMAELRVEDDGVGIPPELLARVFDVFVQGERALQQRQAGLGLGLTLVRRLVELHGGNVQATSPGQGRGSCFAVRLPGLLSPATHATAPRPLLLVGDDGQMAGALESLLEDAALCITHVPDAAAALQALADAALRDALVLVPPALVESDPGGLLQAWRNAAPRARIVALAAAGAAVAHGFDAIVQAPLSPEALQELLAPGPLAIAS